MRTSDFRFAAPDRRLLWGRLALTMSQAATLTGVSERQIQHWMDRGYISPAADGGRKISGESLDTIALIKQARLAGVPLRQAVPMARTYLRNEVTSALDSEMDNWALKELDEKLSIARDGIESVQRVIDGARVGDGREQDPDGRRARSDGVSSQRDTK